MLPPVRTDEEWDAIVPDETVMRPGAADLCARLGVAGAPLTRFREGSQPVYAVGDDLVLKLFPAAAADDGVTEARVLTHVHGRLPVATPRVHSWGAYENGWRYVLMSRLPGEGLHHAWPRVPGADRERLVERAGRTLAALHALDHAPLAGALGPGDWDAFLARQRAGAVERQRARHLPEHWLEQIPDFLDAVAGVGEGAAEGTGEASAAGARRALLHTEFMREHLLAAPAPDGRWELTGLFDFEPAMIGDPAYDFVAVGLYVTRADPRLLARLTTAYGRAFEPRRLLAHTLLHVYSNLPRYLRELPAPPEPTLDALAEHWFGRG
ncbi:phosphotransferase family protein [Streptomyces sp. MNP-20]|uniref:phosphotransferase family protein n=1 Tax=Streptomyces sp. MNP-20 TaxID=2721165 RepID=UPI0015581513|nr:aminoglycoside phosphotransferase family protein [Streptomyces sp. MNP-20]